MEQLRSLSALLDYAKQITAEKGPKCIAVAKADDPGLFEAMEDARKAGIAEGDIIVNVNGTAIKTVNDLGKVIEKNAGKTLRILVQRRDGRIFIPVRLK